MLLGNKKVRGDEKNWCVVLNAIQNEHERKKFAQKISSIFSLSSEEASDLVVSTPIILLDNLTHAIAQKLKDFLHSEGAQIILTNDIFMKRKCYRTVWPEPPSLAFLHEWNTQPQSLPKISEPARVSHQEETVQVTDVLKQPAAPTATSETKLSQELERVKNEYSVLKHESFRLRNEIERLHKENAHMNQMMRNHREETASSREPEKGVKELKAVLSNAEEKYDVLREEYREARAFFEERIKSGLDDNEILKKKITELTQELFNLKQEKTSKEQNDREINGHYLKLKEEHMQELELMKEKQTAMERELNLSLRNVQAEKLARQQAEAQLKELQEKYQQLLNDFNGQSVKNRDHESRVKAAQDKLADLRLSYETREKALQETIREIQNRDSEIELLRSQNKDLKEEIAKKENERHELEIKQDLLLREKHLKWLVAEQERIEVNIKEREEAMKAILAQQQIVEKEIVEGKQKQRALTEQLSRDPGNGKKSRVSAVSPQDVSYKEETVH